MQRDMLIYTPPLEIVLIVSAIQGVYLHANYKCTC